MRDRPARYFSWDEVRCHHCDGLPSDGVLTSDEFHTFTDIMDDVREALDKPLVVSSWYRCPDHPLEAVKRTPGPHTTALAADLIVHHANCQTALQAFLERSAGIDKGIGFAQRGPVGKRFLHFDVASLSRDFEAPRPACWGY